MVQFFERNIEIGIIGAGISGIGAAIQLQRQLQLNSFTLFERNSDVGGTWLRNTYPGCSSDIEGHLFSYSFELNPNWSMNCPPQKEILDYFKRLAHKYDIYSRTKFHSDVRKLTWDESIFKWVLVYLDNRLPDAKEETMFFDIIINGPGALSRPYIPQEYRMFTGPSMHTAEWDHSIKLKNRKVAVIGSGASATQLIPNIANGVEELHVYQRRPQHVVPRFRWCYAKFFQSLFATLPLFLLLWRCIIFTCYEIVHPAFKADSLFNKWGYTITNYHRKWQISKNDNLYKSSIPDHGFGCKRILISNNFYPAMNQPHVKLHISPIERISGRNIFTTDGKSQNIDVLIFATGFHVQEYFSPTVIIGSGGINILDLWLENGPTAYYGITSHYTPNHFYILGPNTSPGHNSSIFQIECQINFTVTLIREMLRKNSRCVSVRAFAEEEYMQKLKEDLKTTVWGQLKCGSWFSDAEGRITTQWPHSCIQYWRQTKNIDFNKFEFM